MENGDETAMFDEHTNESTGTKKVGHSCVFSQLLYC